MRALARFLPAMALAAAGWADNYPRQHGIDVEHYMFRVTLGDDSDEIAGEATITVRFVEDGVSGVSLDLASAKDGKGMIVIGVEGAKSYRHEGDRLVMTMAAAPAKGERRSITVRYRGVAANGLHFSKNRFGERTIFSWNWPVFARQWLPVIDHPYDKATSEFLVTAPSHYQVVANGALVETRDLNKGMRLTHWRESVPVAVWLNNIGVAEFSVRHFDQVRSVPLQTWVFPQDRDNGSITFETPMRQAIDFFSEYIGPYPYEKLAAVQVNGMGYGGMEHASAVFYGEKEVSARPATSLVAHEVSHQWWGDSVTERDWDDAWLSEGFATYFAALALEHYEGRDAFAALMARSRTSILAMEKKSPTPVIHDNLAEISGGSAPIVLVYQKGGWALHMLRNLLGDETFQRGIREYYRRYRDANASTSELMQVMQEISGQELGWFTQQWLYRGASPVVEGTWSYQAASKKILIELKQTQEQLFRLPLEISFSLAGKTSIHPVMLVGRMLNTEIACDGEPANVLLDERTKVLMDAHFHANK